jgi:SPP1 gp7 family putative phage head morphogenesis protein
VDKYLREAKEITPSSRKRFQEELDLWMEVTGTPLMQAMVYPLVYATAERGVRQVVAKLRLTFDLVQEGLTGYAEREAAFLARVMGETTGRAVVDAVSKGLAEGDLIADLTRRLQDLPAFSPTRARTVARTETTRAWNGAQRDAMETYQASSGRIVEKIWLSARDDRVRDEHVELDGTQIPVDQAFSNGLTEPGEPNCRCTLLYTITDPLGGRPDR